MTTNGISACMLTQTCIKRSQTKLAFKWWGKFDYIYYTVKSVFQVTRLKQLLSILEPTNKWQYWLDVPLQWSLRFNLRNID